MQYSDSQDATNIYTKISSVRLPKIDSTQNTAIASESFDLIEKYVDQKVAINKKVSGKSLGVAMAKRARA